MSAIDEPALARRLGVTDRHLRRVFGAQFGVSPVQYAQTQRLLLAKRLLTDTRIPVTEVALASGFASVRRFNALFKERYRMTPSRLRGDPGAVAPGTRAPSTLRVRHRPAARDFEQRLPHTALERRALRIDRNVEVPERTARVRVELALRLRERRGLGILAPVGPDSRVVLLAVEVEPREGAPVRRQQHVAESGSNPPVPGRHRVAPCNGTDCRSGRRRRLAVFGHRIRANRSAPSAR